VRDVGFQFHHYIGVSRRCDEAEFQALRVAIAEADTARAYAKQGERRSVGAPLIGERAIRAASQHVRNWRRPPGPAKH
jgi:hypothetical protein